MQRHSGIREQLVLQEPAGSEAGEKKVPVGGCMWLAGLPGQGPLGAVLGSSNCTPKRWEQKKNLSRRASDLGRFSFVWSGPPS